MEGAGGGRNFPPSFLRGKRGKVAMRACTFEAWGKGTTQEVANQKSGKEIWEAVGFSKTFARQSWMASLK